MNLVYKPFSLILTFAATKGGKRLFQSMWRRIDAEEPPRPTSAEASFGKVIGAAALKGATMATVGAAANRGVARAFEYLTGVWPDDSRENKERRRQARAKDRG
jgi:hypothetical protein